MPDVYRAVRKFSRYLEEGSSFDSQGSSEQAPTPCRTCRDIPQAAGEQPSSRVESPGCSGAMAGGSPGAKRDLAGRGGLVRSCPETSRLRTRRQIMELLSTE